MTRGPEVSAATRPRDNRCWSVTCVHSKPSELHLFGVAISAIRSSRRQTNYVRFPLSRIIVQGVNFGFLGSLRASIFLFSIPTTRNTETSTRRYASSYKTVHAYYWMRSFGVCLFWDRSFIYLQLRLFTLRVNSRTVQVTASGFFEINLSLLFAVSHATHHTKTDRLTSCRKRFGTNNINVPIVLRRRLPELNSVVYLSYYRIVICLGFL